MMQADRVPRSERYLARGAQVGLPDGFTEALFELLIGASCRLEDELIAQHGAAGDGGVQR